MVNVLKRSNIFFEIYTGDSYISNNDSSFIVLRQDQIRSGLKTTNKVIIIVQDINN